MKEWRLITKRTISEETSRIDITSDDDGKPFSCNELMIAVKLKADKDGVVPTYLLNGKWTSSYPYINGKKLSASWFDSYVIKACNSLNVWISKETNAQTISEMYYGMEIPEEHQSEVLKNYIRIKAKDL